MILVMWHGLGTLSVYQWIIYKAGLLIVSTFTYAVYVSETVSHLGMMMQPGMDFL